MLISLVAGFLGVVSSAVLSLGILSLADASAVFSSTIAVRIFLISFAAFGLASLIYLLEAGRQEMVEDIRGE